MPSDDPRHPLNFRIEKLNMLKKTPAFLWFSFFRRRGGGGHAFDTVGSIWMVASSLYLNFLFLLSAGPIVLLSLPLPSSK